jgi:hypothetical protein
MRSAINRFAKNAHAAGCPILRGAVAGSVVPHAFSLRAFPARVEFQTSPTEAARYCFQGICQVYFHIYNLWKYNKLLIIPFFA